MTAVFAGTFDPFTLGHKSIALRAAGMFEHLVIAVAHDCSSKSPCSLEERMEIIRRSMSGEQVEIVPFFGMLTDFMQEIGASILVRGVRNAQDFCYEKSLLGVYRTQLPQIEEVLFLGEPELDHVSSSIVRELTALGGKIDGYVDTNAKSLIEKLYKEHSHGQYGHHSRA